MITTVICNVIYLQKKLQVFCFILLEEQVYFNQTNKHFLMTILIKNNFNIQNNCCLEADYSKE